MYVAIEAYMDVAGSSGWSNSPTPIPSFLTWCLPSSTEFDLAAFGDYLENLGTQPVTVPMSSLVEEMLDSYAMVTHGLRPFSWKENLRQQLFSFLGTRDCFFFPRNRQPVVEVTIAVAAAGSSGMDVHLHYTWNPPVVNFTNLCNIVAEGQEIDLRPSVTVRPIADNAITTAEFWIGNSNWLSWTGESFRGCIPTSIAASVGAERLSSYTMLLELKAITTRYFEGDIRLERVYRCVLPLTVKRAPSRCVSVGYKASSPPANVPVHTTPLVRAPLLKSPVRGGGPDPARLSKLLERKAQCPTDISPLRLNSLSLARLHDAITLSHPPPSELEVRTVHRIHLDRDTWDSLDSDKENDHPHTPVGYSNKRVSSPSVSPRTVDPQCVNFGSTHINRKGKLASHSGSKSGVSSAVASPPAHPITPPTASFLGSPTKPGRANPPDSPVTGSDRMKDIMERRRAFGNNHYLGQRTLPRRMGPTVGSDVTRARALALVWGNQNMDPKDWERAHQMFVDGGVEQSEDEKVDAQKDAAGTQSQKDIDEWQETIRKNFEEAQLAQESQKQAKRESKIDVTMEDAIESDAEWSSDSEL
jgi:hypothetical protein